MESPIFRLSRAESSADRLVWAAAGRSGEFHADHASKSRHVSFYPSADFFPCAFYSRWKDEPYTGLPIFAGAILAALLRPTVKQAMRRLPRRARHPPPLRLAIPAMKEKRLLRFSRRRARRSGDYYFRRWTCFNIPGRKAFDSDCLSQIFRIMAAKFDRLRHQRSQRGW